MFTNGCFITGTYRSFDEGEKIKEKKVWTFTIHLTNCETNKTTKLRVTEKR